MTDTRNKRAIVLLSGGVDSTTVLAIARREVEECIAITFIYGQKHAAEVDAAARIAEKMGVEKHLIIPISLGQCVVSALTDETIPVPKGGACVSCDPGIPPTYVPARNTIFLSHALAIAESTGSGTIYIGVSSVDYSGYPDCRPEFIRAFQRLAELATKSAVEGLPVRIRAPLLNLSKAETIREGLRLGVDYSLTLSCYEPGTDGRPCGECDSCRLRRRGFEEAGVNDPACRRNS